MLNAVKVPVTNGESLTRARFRFQIYSMPPWSFKAEPRMITVLEQWTDLPDSRLNTLKQYHVKWTHVQTETQQPNTDFDHHLLKRMWLNAAEGVKMQCAREYCSDGQEAHATELYKMTNDERRNLCVCERYLAQFGSLASISATRSNKIKSN